MSKIYAIGGIHGQFRLLHKALGLIELDGGPEASIVFLGGILTEDPTVAGS